MTDLLTETELQPATATGEERVDGLAIIAWSGDACSRW